MKAVKEINFLSHIFQKTVFHRERTVFWIWMSSGLIYAIVKLLIGKYNNYKIFENVFPHVINGLPLYVEYPTEYYDVNHYGPIFALVIAPFSILPEWLGMIFCELAIVATASASSLRPFDCDRNYPCRGKELSS